MGNYILLLLSQTLKSTGLDITFEVKGFGRDVNAWVKVFRVTVKPALSGHSKRRPKIGFQDRLSLNDGQKYCRMLQESILQYFRPSLSYFLSLRLLFCQFLSGRLRQVLLYS